MRFKYSGYQTWGPEHRVSSLNITRNTVRNYILNLINIFLLLNGLFLVYINNVDYDYGLFFSLLLINFFKITLNLSLFFI